MSLERRLARLEAAAAEQGVWQAAQAYAAEMAALGVSMEAFVAEVRQFARLTPAEQDAELLALGISQAEIDQARQEGQRLAEEARQTPARGAPPTTPGGSGRSWVASWRPCSRCGGVWVSLPPATSTRPS